MQGSCPIWYCLLRPAWLYHIFPHLINGTNFGEGGLLHVKKVSWSSVQLLPETFLILKKIQRYIINVYRFLCKLPVIVILEWNLNFLNRFSKSSHIWNFTKIRPAGTELFHADRRIWWSLRIFANAPKYCAVSPQNVLKCTHNDS